MRQFVTILFLSSCLIFSCHSNKKGGHKAHNKKGKHSSVASSGGSAGSTGGTISKTDSASKYKKTRFGEGRPKINSGGVSGTGSGGSYASNSYRRDILSKDSPSLKKKEYFKKRMEENDRMYYGEEVREEMPAVIQDTTSTLEVDTEMMEGDSLLFNN